MNRYIIAIGLILFASVGFTAGAGSNVSLGQAASNVNNILLGVSGILEAIIYIAGIAVLCSAAMKFRIHLQTPQQVPISTVVTEVILAIVLLILPTVTKYANMHLFEEGDVVGRSGAGSQAVNKPARSAAGQPVGPQRSR